MTIKRLLVIIMFLVPNCLSLSQVENVPAGNQVYEFLDRMGMKDILPLYSNSMIPISRRDVADYLTAVDENRTLLNGVEIRFLEKFKQEFMHEIDPSAEDPAVLFRGSPASDVFSDKEKYLYDVRDSSLSFYLEFIGSLDYRRTSGGGSYGPYSSAFEEHGGRIRGTIKNRVGYYLQATNGTMFGDRESALTDPRLKGNVKFNDLGSPYFDFTEAYLKADLDWFNLQFGREHTLIGTGYSDRLILSGNSPVMDFLRLDFSYKTFRFVFLQGSLVDPAVQATKYLALHRAQFSLLDIMNIGFSEMIIYQRHAADFAYLNPINFYKSSEHSLRDRDNAFLNLDVEIFPAANYKVYGTWLIDDIDFKKMGTGWWGNEFGWQFGINNTEFAGIANLDATVEYTRLEPYVYSNRIPGNSFSNNQIGIGHHLQPNSDEWMARLSYGFSEKLRTRLSGYFSRHGENIYSDGFLSKNVGGDILVGHSETDSEIARFLDGKKNDRKAVRLDITYEFITNFFILCNYERCFSQDADPQASNSMFSLIMYLEY